MKPGLLVAVAAACMVLAAPADAQFKGLKKAVGMDTSEEKEVQAPSGAASQEEMVQSFYEAKVMAVGGQIELAEAFGMKDEVARLKAEKEALESASTEQIQEFDESYMALSHQVGVSMQEKMDAGVELSADGRSHYLNGLALTARALVAAKDMAGDAQAFGTSAQNEIAGTPVLQLNKVKGKFAAGLYVVKGLPGFTSDLSGNLANLIKFAKSADMQVPDDPTELLASL